MKYGWLMSSGCLKSAHYMEGLALYEKAAKLLNLSLEIIYNNELIMGIEKNDLLIKGKKCVHQPDFILFLDKDIRLAKALEAKGMKVFNSAEVIEICDDKSATFMKLAGHGIPMPKTIVAPLVYAGYQEEGTGYIDFIESELGYPHIIKESFGSFGEQVYLITSREALIEKRKALVSIPHIYQAFVASSKGRDVRLNVVGGQVVATMLRQSTTDFRANITSGGQATSYKPPQSFYDLALKVCEVLDIDFAGVDLLFGPDGEPILCEVNSNAHILGIKACTGINVAEFILAHIKTKCDA